MTTRIETGLKERLDAEYHTLCNGGETFVFPRGCHGPLLDAPAIQVLRQDLGGPDSLRKWIATANAILPEAVQHNIVVACDDRHGIAQAQRSLEESGFPVVTSGKLAHYLSALGMLVVHIPPRYELIERLAALPQSALLGDGDRVVSLPKPLTSNANNAVWPRDAVSRTMCGGEPMPDDRNLPAGAIRVAVIDTGIDAEHVDLRGRIEAQFDFSRGGTGPIDPSGHGTHVAGILLAVAPFVRLLDIQVWDPLGASTMTLIAGIGCAIEQGVDVLNLSMGSTAIPSDGRSLESRAIQEAADRGIVCCVAAGNSGERNSAIAVPSDAKGAICTAAVDDNGRWVSFSSTGPSDAPEVTGQKPNLAAPGVNLIAARSQYSKFPAYDGNGDYVLMSGTSMAAPIIAGLCAHGLARKAMVGERNSEAVSNALLGSAQLTDGESERRLGRGVPQMDSFLQSLHLTDTESDATTAMMASNRMEDPIVGKVVYPAHEDYNSLRSRAAILKGLEQAFVNGVKQNVCRFGLSLVEVMTGKRGNRPGKSMESSSYQKLRDHTAILGLDPIVLDAMPGDAESWLTFQGGALRRSTLVVGIKSFCGTGFLTEAGSTVQAMSEINRFRKEWPQKLISKGVNVPDNALVALAILIPESLEISTGILVPNSTQERLFVFRERPESIDGADVALDNTDTSWEEFRAFSPMQFEARLEYYEKALMAQIRKQSNGTVVSMETIEQAWGLNQIIRLRLIEELVSCKHSQIRELKRTRSDEEYYVKLA